MGLIGDQMAADMALVMDPDMTPNVEAVTYKPFGGSSFSANVCVNRKADDVPGESGMVSNFNIAIFLPRSTNIASINTAGDFVTVATITGGVATDHPVIDILSESPGGWLLLLR
jgi:hypothetical protein